MRDDLEQLVGSTEGEGPSAEFVAALRKRVEAAAAAPTAASESPDLVVDAIDLRSETEKRGMNRQRTLAIAAAVVLVMVGLLVAFGGGGSEVDTAQRGDDPQQTDVDDGQRPADDVQAQQPQLLDVETGPTGSPEAAAGCGLSDAAVVTSTLDAAGERVTFEVASAAACAGVDLQIVATPAVQGLPITQNVTLDDLGRATASDQLFGSRRVPQGWTVELIVPETGGVASVDTFVLAGFCDLEATADLQATYVAERNAIDIVFTVDPSCAGRFFTFDPDEFFESSPRGGWATYEVDEDGRIEVSEILTDRAPDDALRVEAFPAPESRGVVAGSVAAVVVEIGG